VRQTIAIINQKGGVGKTTTATNVAAYTAKLGNRVLIIDLDPQANTTGGLGINKASLNISMKDVLAGHKELKDIIVPAASSKGVFIAPSEAALASSEIDLAALPDREKMLKNSIDKLEGYDYVLIDCPPALGLLTINALTAADTVLIPVQAEYYALEGLSQLLQVMQQVGRHLNPDLELLGVVITMYDKRTSLSEQVYKEIKAHFGDKVFSTVIPRNVRLAEAPSFGKSILEHDKWSKGARAYKNLAKEMVARVEG
jgi:chromosome partitioning protein